MKKIGSVLLRVGVSVLLLAVLFLTQKLDAKTIWHSIRHADRGLLAAGCAMIFFSFLLCFIRWRQLLHAIDIRIPLSRLLVSFSGGVFFNAILISSIGGDFVRSIDLAVFTKRPRQIVATVLLDRLSGYVGLVLVVLVAAFLGKDVIGTSKSILFSIAVIVVILAGILLVLFNHYVYTKVNRILGSSRLGKVGESIKNLHEELHIFKQHKGVLFFSVVLSILVQTVAPLSSYLVARALGVHVSLTYFFIFIPLVGAITMLPISIGGLGVRENSMVLFFKQVGVPQELTIAMSLLGFFFTLGYSAIAGLIYVLTVHNRRLQSHPSPAL